jgi:FAD dependent oxidoreductase TIGR03364
MLSHSAGKRAIVVGAGIVGLAMTRALALRGYQVTLIERHGHQQGASVRNFGMVWLIGQPHGPILERAQRGRAIWTQLCTETGTWYDPVGSLQLAYSVEEASVLHEFYEQESHARPLRILSSADVASQAGAVKTEGLVAALHHADDVIVDPRQAIRNFTTWLKEKLAVELRFGATVTALREGMVTLSDNTSLETDLVFVCPGADLQTLLPGVDAGKLTLCKLQMMRMAAQPEGWRIGPALCGGLSLIHYASFANTPSLPKLKHQYADQYPEYLRWGIHVMASQNAMGEIAVGDSHEYGREPSPFNQDRIDQLILDYLKKFARFRDETIIERWHGIYAKTTDNQSEFLTQARL